MKNVVDDQKDKVALLKRARLCLLKIHKLLIEIERKEIESRQGSITSGHFLNLLLSDPKLQWLRNFSTLVVEIDEMLDLDDGFTDQMIEKFFTEINVLVNLNSNDDEFKSRYKNSIQNNSEIAFQHSEIKQILSTI